MASTNDLQERHGAQHRRATWAVVEFPARQAERGPAFEKCARLKNVESNKTVDKTFNAGTKVETATVDRRSMQYLYNDGGTRTSSWTSRSTSRPRGHTRDPRQCRQLLLEQQEVVIATNEGPRPVRRFARLGRGAVVTFTGQPRRGQRHRPRKPATLETGHEIQVPLFINQGKKVKVDTRDSSYMGRVKS